LQPKASDKIIPFLLKRCPKNGLNPPRFAGAMGPMGHMEAEPVGLSRRREPSQHEENSGPPNGHVKLSVVVGPIFRVSRTKPSVSGCVHQAVIIDRFPPDLDPRPSVPGASEVENFSPIGSPPPILCLPEQQKLPISPGFFAANPGKRPMPCFCVSISLFRARPDQSKRAALDLEAQESPLNLQMREEVS